MLISLTFLDLKKNHGKEEMRARDLFYAMWIPDLFMERVEEDGDGVFSVRTKHRDWEIVMEINSVNSMPQL